MEVFPTCRGPTSATTGNVAAAFFSSAAISLSIHMVSNHIPKLLNCQNISLKLSDKIVRRRAILVYIKVYIEIYI
jgi:hypothetical protein